MKNLNEAAKQLILEDVKLNLFTCVKDLENRKLIGISRELISKVNREANRYSYASTLPNRNLSLLIEEFNENVESFISYAIEDSI